MLLADFHLHSTFSDGRLTIPELVDFFGSRGFGAIAITDHLCENETTIGQASHRLGLTLNQQNFTHYLEVIAEESERARRLYNMVVIPGVELTRNALLQTDSAHILALGINQFISPNLTVEQTLRQIREMNAISIAAHPVSTKKLERQTFHLWNRRHELASQFDAWEVASGPFIFDEVKQSGLPMVASSDMHNPKQMTSWKSILNCSKDQASILDCIRRQKIDFRFYVDKAKPIPGGYYHARKSYQSITGQILRPAN